MLVLVHCQDEPGLTAPVAISMRYMSVDCVQRYGGMNNIAFRNQLLVCVANRAMRMRRINQPTNLTLFSECFVQQENQKRI